MEEKQKNNQKPEFKGNLGFIWLVGILVILLGCTIVYTLKITKENKELKQSPQVQPILQTPVTTQEQVNGENVTAADTEETKTKKTEEVDKDALEVYGLDTRFKELSKVAIKTSSTWEQKNGEWKEKKINIEYDLNNDGKKEKITGKEDKISINGNAFYKADEESRCANIYIVDLEGTGNSKEVIIEESSGTGAGEWTYFTIYKLNNGKLKEINYKMSNEGDVSIDKFYLDGNGKFIVLDEIQENLSPLFAIEYFEIKNNNISKSKIDISKISNKSFIINKSNKKSEIAYYMFNSKKEAKEYRLSFGENDDLKKFIINSNKKINILSYKDGVMKVKLSNGDIRYIYSAQRLYWG